MSLVLPLRSTRSEPALAYGNIPLEDMARVELLSPMQAMTRYGNHAGNGAILVETKRGTQVRRTQTANNNISGLDWSAESVPYPMARVFGSSFLGNAVGLGLGVLLVERCLTISQTKFSGLRTKCGAAMSVGSRFLTYKEIRV